MARVRPASTGWRDPGRVTLDEAECWTRLRGARHGVLSTLHAERGGDAVPVVFAVVYGQLVVPIDTVKPKREVALTRLANVARDPRCVLLVEHYSDDWSQLRWGRVHALARKSEAFDPTWVAALGDRYPTYRTPGSVVAALVLDLTGITGWAAARTTAS